MQNTVSLIIYLFTYIISAFLLKISKKHSNQKIDVFFIFSLIFPVLLAALRYDVGTDYSSYVSIYNQTYNLSFSDWLHYHSDFDGTPFFQWIACRIGGLFNSTEVFFGIMAFAVYFPIALLIKKKYTSNITFLLAFSYLTTLFTTSLNIVKQGAAMAIILFGMTYIFERKFKQFILIVVVAMLFHPTAVVALPMYFLVSLPNSKIKFKRVIIYLSTVLMVFLFPYILQLLPGRFSGYINYTEEIGNKTFWIELLLLILFIFFKKKLQTIDSLNSTLTSIFLVGMIFAITGFSSPFVKRVAGYYTYVQYLLLAQIPLIFPRREQIIYKSFIFIYIVALFVITYFILGYAKIIPYQIKGG